MLNKIKEELLNVVLPRYCVGCGKEGNYICSNCELFLSEVANEEKTTNIWEYEGILKKALEKTKKQGLYDILEELTEKAFMVMKNDIQRFEPFLKFLFSKDACFSFVPLTKKEEKQRGFNQSELIARNMGKITDKRICQLLKKTKTNLTQESLNPEERIKNVNKAYVWIGQEKAEKVILVDDFIATGATLEECSRILKENGVKEVWKFSLARQLTI